jgi:site-specific DNA-methyltransferase (adenine-specific)
MCGDSTVVTDVEALMQGQKADMCFTDPPYGISLGFETPEQARARNRRTDGKTVLNDDLQGDGLMSFLASALSMADSSMKAGAAFYVCSPIDQEVRKFIQAIEAVGWHYQSGLVWNKSSLSLSRHDYHPKHEIIHYGWKTGAAHKWYADRKQTTVFDFDKPSRSEDHPTTKPVGLVEYYVGNVSLEGDLVVDIFLGSGTTLIAAEKTGRTCYGMELNPPYCDVIVRRWQNATGKKATLEATGQAFDELAEAGR